MGAEEFDDAAAKAFFEFIDTVIFGGGVGEALNAVEIVATKMVVGGVFNHVPLDGVLGVIIHVFFVGAREEIDNFVAIEHKHGSGERGGVAVDGGFGEDEFDFWAEKVVHGLVIRERLVGEIAALAGGGGDAFEDI